MVGRSYRAAFRSILRARVCKPPEILPKYARDRNASRRWGNLRFLCKTMLARKHFEPRPCTNYQLQWKTLKTNDSLLPTASLWSSPQLKRCRIISSRNLRQLGAEGKFCCQKSCFSFRMFARFYLDIRFSGSQNNWSLLTVPFSSPSPLSNQCFHT